MDKITKTSQDSTTAITVLRELASQLAQDLTAPTGDSPGDPQWSVSAQGFDTLQVEHPQLQNSYGPDILQLQVEKSGDTWFVFTKNKSETTPLNQLVAKQNGAPGRDWDIRAITQSAAQWFKDQKEQLVQSVEQDLPPLVRPNMSQQGGANPPPLASQRQRRAEMIREIRGKCHTQTS